MFKIIVSIYGAILMIASILLVIVAVFEYATVPSCTDAVVTAALMFSGFMFYAGFFAWCLRD